MFSLISSFILGVEKVSFVLVLIFTFICGGLMLVVDGEPHYSATGAVLVLISTVGAGIRWVLFQKLTSGIGHNSVCFINCSTTTVMFRRSGEVPNSNSFSNCRCPKWPIRCQ